MKISQVRTNYYNAPIKNNNKLNFTSEKRNKKATDGYERSLRISAAASLACLAIAYGGGKIILEQHRDRMNEILDKYEQELVEHKRNIEKTYEEYEKAYSTHSATDTIRFDTDSLEITDN